MASSEHPVKIIELLLEALLTMLIVSPEYWVICCKVCFLVFKIHWLLELGFHSFSLFSFKRAVECFIKKIKFKKKVCIPSKVWNSKKLQTWYDLQYFFLGFIANYMKISLFYLLLKVIALDCVKTFNGKPLKNNHCQRILYCGILPSKIQKGKDTTMPICLQS